MIRDIRKIVSKYRRKYQTSDPFEIAEALGIQIQVGNLGTREGCYMYLKRHKCIFLNESLDEHERLFVMAHELGHAILHPRENCYYIRNKTGLLISKTEMEANKFAIELLLPDDVLIEYINSGYTTEQVSRITGYHRKMIELRLN
ncbi:MAG: ImmA/IrrE family metallo-endopeptidase [Blautia sp.]|nr:ImmA/IrrE family metallo-endopeptidase [Blautia sp.]